MKPVILDWKDLKVLEFWTEVVEGTTCRIWHGPPRLRLRTKGLGRVAVLKIHFLLTYGHVPKGRTVQRTCKTEGCIAHVCLVAKKDDDGLDENME